MTTNLIISSDEASLRLDKMLTMHFPQHSRSYFQYLIQSGNVLVNGVQLKKRIKLKMGDSVQIDFIDPPDLSAHSEDIPLDILFEDDHLIAINKPAGMVVHPAPGSPSKTFANALMFHCNNLKKEEFDPLRPGIVHRLDKETSGVLIAAKTYEAHQLLVKQFSERKIKKTYLAICSGNIEPGIISAPIGRHPVKRKEMAVAVEGKEAITHVKILVKKGDLSLIEAQPITGRTHQIRVHLKHKGSPIVGDPVYGLKAVNQKYNAERQFLHAFRLKLQHPISEKTLEFKAPIPPDMLDFLIKNGLKKYL